MVLDWMRKVHQLEYAHRFESLKWSRAERTIGLSAFCLATLIACSYRFPSWPGQSYFVASASTLVAILTGLQTFLKPSEKSEMYQKTASNYEKLRHEIELLLTMQANEKTIDQRLLRIQEEWKNLDAINVSESKYVKAKMRVRRLNKYPKELEFLGRSTESQREALDIVAEGVPDGNAGQRNVL
jgi:hypothetical protein